MKFELGAGRWRSDQVKHGLKMGCANVESNEGQVKFGLCTG